MVAVGTTRKGRGGHMSPHNQVWSEREKSSEGQSMEAESLKSKARRVRKLRAGLSHHHFQHIFFLISEIMPNVTSTVSNN